MKTLEEQANELEKQLRQAAGLDPVPVVTVPPQFTKEAYNTFKNIVYPLVRTIREMPELAGSVVSFEGHSHQGLMMASIILEVQEPHVYMVGSVLTTIFAKGGLASQAAPYDDKVDPVCFTLTKRVWNRGWEVHGSNVLEASVDPGYDRSAAKRQIALLRGILSDPRNLISIVPPAFYPHVSKAAGVSIVA